MKGINKVGYLLLGLSFLSILAMIAIAESEAPYGVRWIENITSSRSNLTRWPPAAVDAEAGNVTEIRLEGTATTKAWQGFYGNISGTLTLENSDGYVFYNWTSAEPKGEVYASVNTSVVWSSIRCFDWTGDTIDLEGEEARYGIQDDDSDGINETYVNTGLTSNFFVGSRDITAESTLLGFDCHATNPYTYSLMSVAQDFENVLLTDGSALVFTTIIENNDADNQTDKVGFDNREHDFQLLVAENGHDGNEDTATLYYFWAEIE